MVSLSPKSRIFFSVVLTVLIADVITKALAVRNLQYHDPQEVIGEFFRFTLSFNTGAAFGISILGGSRWVYVGLTALILFTLIGMYREARDDDSWQILALGLIVGGALGNLYDRLRWERGVVDFIDVGLGEARFWTFNIADSGISVGAVLMVIIYIIHSRSRPTDPSTA